MRATRLSTASAENRLAYSTKELQNVCGCGLSTAIRIGENAGAKIKLGRRTMWNAAKIRDYLDAMSAGCTEK